MDDSPAQSDISDYVWWLDGLLPEEMRRAKTVAAWSGCVLAD